eukprot:gene12365-2255_t
MREPCRAHPNTPGTVSSTPALTPTPAQECPWTPSCAKSTREWLETKPMDDPRAKGKVVRVGNVSVFYRLAKRLPVKDGAPVRQQRDVLLLHGRLFNADTWLTTGTYKFFSSKGYRTVGLDLPGCSGIFSIPAVLRSNHLLGAFVPVAVELPAKLNLEVLAARAVHIKLPTLVIRGEYDLRLGVASEVLLDIPGSELQIVGKQHACYLDDPGGFH